MDEQVLGLFQADLIVQHHAYIRAQAEVLQERRRQRARRRYSKKRFWVRTWLTEDERVSAGQYHNLMVKLRNDDVQSFTNYLRMPPDMFQFLLNRLTPRLQKKDTKFRRPLEPGLKLAVVLRHLATGDNYPSLQYNFRVSRHTIASFLPDVCQAIIDEFAEEEVQYPVTPDEWREVALQFQRKWNVPHALGALDGKHVAIKCLIKSGSYYYNYKGFYSIVLMSLVDANYRFLWCDVGGAGHMSDAQIFNGSELKEAMDTRTIRTPYQLDETLLHPRHDQITGNVQLPHIKRTSGCRECLWHHGKPV